MVAGEEGSLQGSSSALFFVNGAYRCSPPELAEKEP